MNPPTDWRSAGLSGNAPEAGRTFGRYQLRELVAVSGMGVVYRAWDPTLECVVAIKLVSEETIPDESARRQLYTEARIASSLNHPNICKIKDVVEESGQAGIVMEFVEGQVLNNVIPANVGLPFDLVVAYGVEIADAVSHAHEHDVIHRDLKSSNVMVTGDGHTKLLDFGLSKIQRRFEVPSSLETPGISSSSDAIAGTPPYWAPEILKHCPTDPRSDIWSLGVLLYEMASGHMPFKGATVIELGSAILHDAPLPLTEQVPESLSKIIHHCLRKQMGQRYQHVGEILAALEAIEPHSEGRPQRRHVDMGAQAPTIRSVAVLPLENLSGSPDQEYFADGLTESLITALAKIDGLRVISRTSTGQYKHVRKTLPQIARELSVDAIVEGSVRRDGDRVRITAELIEGRTDQHLWTESYDRDLRDILTLQSQVAAAIAGEIRAKLRPSSESLRVEANPLSSNSPTDPSLLETVDAENDKLLPSTPVNPKAYDLYLKGRYFWNNHVVVTAEDARKAVEYYQQAIEIDPQYAPTYAGLAHCLVLMGAGEYGLRAPSEIMPKAKEAARTALNIDDSIAEAHLSLAMVKFRFDWDWEGAEEEFKRAIELNHGYSAARYWYSVYLLALARFDEAFTEAMIARQLSPFSPVMHFSLGLLLYASCQNDEAIEQLRETVALDAKFPLPHIVLGLTFGRKGRFDEAIVEFQQALTSAGANPLWSGFLGQVYAAAGKTEDAVQILHELRTVSAHRHVPPVAFAIVYAGLGKLDDAFHWLEKAADDRDGLLIYLKVGSAFDNLRSDRRFPAILTRVGLQGDPGLDVPHPAPLKRRVRIPVPLPPVPPLPSIARLLIGIVLAIVAYEAIPHVIEWIWPPKLTLAIQQFKTPGGEADPRRLAEIVREEIFTRLSKLHPERLGVIELTTGESGLSFEQVCDRHKPTYVLAGAIYPDGNHMAITNQLVSCKDQTGVAGDHYDTEPTGSNIGPLVDDIVQKVLAALPKDVQPEHKVDPKAYEAYLNGRFLWNRRTTQSLTEAISSFQKAIEYDGNYAPSYAGLADCYALLGSAPYTTLPPSEAFPKAKANARKALALDEGLAEAHVSLAYSTLVYDWNYAEAEKEFRRAIELRPGYATAHQYYAYYLTAMGDLSQAIAERKLALSIEPRSPLLNTALGEEYLHARQFKDSIEPNQKALSLDPNYAVAVINLGRAYEQQRMYPQALHAYQSILAFAPQDPALLALLGHLYAVSGQRAAAHKIISQLQQISRDRYVPSLYVAMVYTGLGDKDEAFAWLDKAYAERCEYLVYLPTEPIADPLRSDPRFPALLQRLGLKK
jgi:TolB-like protein/Tfp pilus assembly protein PilF